MIGRIVNLTTNDKAYSVTSSLYFTLVYTQFWVHIRSCIQMVAYTNANHRGNNVFHLVTSVEVTIDCQVFILFVLYLCFYNVYLL